MADNRIFSKDACTVCGRLGDPHAEFCVEVTEWLREQHQGAPWKKTPEEEWGDQPKIGPMTEAASYVDAHLDDELVELDGRLHEN